MNHAIQPQRVDYHFQTPEGERRGSYHLWECRGSTPEQTNP